MTNESSTKMTENENPALSIYFVGKDIVNTRVKNFMSDKHEVLTSNMAAKGLEKEESKYVWYPKDYFEMICDEMNRYGANGLRVYFGQYGNDAGDTAGQLGLLLVLTQFKNGKIYDLLFEEQGDFEARKAKPRERKVNFEQNTGKRRIREFNAMLPIPPGGADHVPSFPQES